MLYADFRNTFGLDLLVQNAGAALVGVKSLAPQAHHGLRFRIFFRANTGTRREYPPRVSRQPLYIQLYIGIGGNY